MAMRTRMAVCGAVALVTHLLGTSPAQADSTPAGSIGVTTSIVTGQTGSDLGTGFSWGFVAGWQPLRPEQSLGWAVRWSTQFLYFGYLTEAPAARITGRIHAYQFDLTARARLRLGNGANTFLTAGGGMGLLRSNEPLTQHNARAWAGPIAVVGIDRYWLAGTLLSFDFKYSVVSDGPSMGAISLTLQKAL